MDISQLLSGGLLSPDQQNSGGLLSPDQGSVNSNAGSAGLLSPDQQHDANRSALLSAAAALLKASGPSPFKSRMTTAAGLGDALAAGLQGRQQATDSALRDRLLAGQIRQQAAGQTLQALQLAAQYKSLGLPVPPQVQRILDAASGGAGTAGGGVAQAVQSAQPSITVALSEGF
jgi:hypothetical protein